MSIFFNIHNANSQAKNFVNKAEISFKFQNGNY